MIQFFRERLRKIQVQQKTNGKFVKGEWQEDVSELAEAWMIPSAIPKTYLRQQAEGEYTSKDMAFYQRAKILFNENDVIIYNRQHYKIHDIATREDEVLTVYYCKFEKSEVNNVTDG